MLKVMGYGTSFDAVIFLNRERYDTVYDVEQEIAYLEKQIRDLKETILMYCASGCNGVYSKECEDNPLNPVEAMHKEVSSIFELYDEYSSRLVNLEYLKEDWDEKEGKFKTAEVG